MKQSHNSMREIASSRRAGIRNDKTGVVQQSRIRQTILNGKKVLGFPSPLAGEPACPIGRVRGNNNI